MAKWIVYDPDYITGSARIAETRLPLWALLDELAQGYSIQEISERYPGVSQIAVRGVLSELAMFFDCYRIKDGMAGGTLDELMYQYTPAFLRFHQLRLPEEPD